MRISDWSSDVCSSDLVAVSMPVAGWLVDRVGIRVPALLGFGIVASTMWVLGHLEASMPESRIVFVLVIQGVGTGFAYVPTTVGAMNEIGRASCRERGCKYV